MHAVIDVKTAALLALLFAACAVTLAQDAGRRARQAPSVTFDRLLHAEAEPQNWLTYSGTLSGIRHSPLTQITRTNLGSLEMAWLWQHQSQDVTAGLARIPTAFQSTPFVVDGILYTVSPPNDVVAMDAATGRVIWTHPYAPRRRTPSYVTQRGLAILGDTLFMGTRDARLRAMNATTGDLAWDATVADPADPGCGQEMCYSITLAPLVVKNKVIVELDDWP